LRPRRSFYDSEADRNLYRTGNGFAYFTELNRTGRRLNLQLSGAGYTRDYRADLGFTTRADTNIWSVYARYNSEPKPQRRLISWTAIYTELVQFDWRGRSQYAYHFPRVALNFKRQTFLQLAVYRDYARLFEEEFGAKRTAARAGAFFGPAERSTFWNGYTITFGTNPTRKYSANVVVDGSWKVFDYDFGAGPKFPRVSPAALADPTARSIPGLETATTSRRLLPGSLPKRSGLRSITRRARLCGLTPAALPTIRTYGHCGRVTISRALPLRARGRITTRWPRASEGSSCWAGRRIRARRCI